MPDVVDAHSTEQFVASIGVVTHANYWDTGYGLPDQSSADITKIESSLQYLGVSSIRDGSAYPFTLPALLRLGQDGFKLDVVYFTGPNSESLQQQVTDWASLAPYLNSVEGPNESDNSSVSTQGLSGPAATRQIQAELYSLVRNDPSLSKVPIIEASLAFPSSYAALATLSHADFGNTHSYFFDFTKSIAGEIPGRIVEEGVVAPGLPTIATESGWESSPLSTDWFNVDQATQAKLTLDLLLDQYKAGVSMTYLYQLLDLTKVQDWFGLFKDEGTPKLAATALHNMTSILADQGNGGVPTSGLLYSLSMQPSTMQTLLLQKSDGTFELAIWNEPSIWNSTTHTTITALSVATTINLGSQLGSVQLYDPLQGTLPLQSWNRTSSVSILIPDHPIFLQIEAQAALAASVSAPSDMTLSLNATAPTPFANALILTKAINLPTSSVLPIADAPETASITNPFVITPTVHTPDDAGETFRFFDSTHGTQLLTSSMNERDALIANRPDLIYEGKGMGTVAANLSDRNVAPVFRFFNKIDGTHFFTTDVGEKDTTAAIRSDLTFEGSSFNEHLGAQAGDVAVYRFFNETNGSHFFTSSETERASLLTTRSDMINEGIAFYAPL